MRNAGTVLNVLREGCSAVFLPRSPRRNRWRASCWETSPRGSDRGGEKDPPSAGTSPAAYRCTGQAQRARQDLGDATWSVGSREL